MAKLEVYNQNDVKGGSYARVLILGPAKAGKSSCIALTAPKPLLVLNCDGEDALQGATKLGAEYSAVNVTDRESWNAAIDYACEQAKAKRIKSIAVDTISLLGDTIKEDAEQKLKGFDVWNELGNQMVRGLKRLKDAPAHLFITAHMVPGSDKEEGILPALQGNAKTRIPALINDWILLQVMPEQDPERVFYLGPQKGWTHSGRNIRKTCAIEADIGLLLEELGIKA